MVWPWLLAISAPGSDAALASLPNGMALAVCGQNAGSDVAHALLFNGVVFSLDHVEM